MRVRGGVDSKGGYEPARAAAADIDMDAAAQPPSLAPVLSAVVIASFGALAFGFHLGVVNGPLEAIAADLGFAGNAGLQGTVVSSLLAGAAVGSLGGSGLADSFGRRTTLLLDAVPMAVGALLSATATGLQGMIAGRFLAGIGIGLSSALVPLYISEVAPSRVRGALGSINQLVICIGIVAALVANVTVPAARWRSLFLLATAPAAALGLGMLAAPESPVWLQSKGRTADAEAAARRLWGATAAGQLSDTAGAGAGKAAPVGMGELLGSRSVRIGMALFLLQQASGINAIVYFSSSVFAQAGIASAALASAAVGVTNVVGTLVAASLMDRAGRKQLLALSFGGMGVSMLAMAAGLGLPSLAPYAGPVALVGTLAYIVSFALGAGPVPGLLVPEITPLRLRGRAVSASLATHWVANLAIGQLFLPALGRFGVSAVYLFFAAVCGFTVAFTGSQVVETKGLSLEEIEYAMSK